MVGTGVKAAITARTVAKTSTGVAVGSGSWILGVAVGTGVTDGIGVNEPTIACAVASTPMGVTDGTVVNESTKARTVVLTSMGVAVGIGSSI